MENISLDSLSNGQKQIINMVSHLKTNEEIEGVRNAILGYLTRKLDDEMNKLWADGTLNDKKIESFRNLHERTPYNPLEKEKFNN